MGIHPSRFRAGQHGPVFSAELRGRGVSPPAPGTHPIGRRDLRGRRGWRGRRARDLPRRHEARAVVWTEREVRGVPRRALRAGQRIRDHHRALRLRRDLRDRRLRDRWRRGLRLGLSGDGRRLRGALRRRPFDEGFGASKVSKPCGFGARFRRRIKSAAPVTPRSAESATSAHTSGGVDGDCAGVVTATAPTRGPFSITGVSTAASEASSCVATRSR